MQTNPPEEFEKPPKPNPEGRARSAAPSCYNTAPWMEGGWIRPDTKDLKYLERRIINKKLLWGDVCAIIGRKQRPRAQFMSYSDWYFLCCLAGIETPDLRFSGSKYWSNFYQEELTKKVAAKPTALDGLTLKVDLQGQDEKELMASLGELAMEVDEAMRKRDRKKTGPKPKKIS